ncbi:MAG: acyl-CoA dehydrogenase family protein [Chloroflexota bacterium]
MSDEPGARLAPYESPLLPLTPEGRGAVERARDLARRVLAPRAAEYDESGRFPRENYRAIHEAGLSGLPVSKRYGGVGADSLTYALCLLEFAKGCSATGLTLNMHSIVCTFIEDRGTQDQCERFLRAVTGDGKIIGSITSEPDATIRSGLTTSFRPVDGGYHVSGVKAFCSIGEYADYYLISGMIDGQTDPRHGVAMAVIPNTADRVQVVKPWNAVGMRGTASHTLRFDAFVPHADVIGKPGERLGVNERFSLGYAAAYTGVAEAAYEFVAEYVQSHTATGSDTPMGTDRQVQREIAELATVVRSARLMLYEAALLRDGSDRRQATLAVNQAKYLGGEAAAQVTARAMKLLGGRGFLRDLPLERLHRDALAGPVQPPGSEACLQTAGRMLCGLDPASIDYL